MEMHPDASRRFQRYFNFVWTFLNLTQREIQERCGISESRRATLWRASEGQSTGLTLEEAHRIVHFLSLDPLVDLDGELVWIWIISGANPPRRLREFLASRALYPHPRGLRDLSNKLQDFESRTQEKITCAAVPMLSALPETVAMVVHRNCLRFLGSHGRRLGTGLNNFHRERRNVRVNARQGRSRQTHLVFASNLRHFPRGHRTIFGIARGSSAEGIQEFAENAIEAHGDLVGVLDENLPADLRLHFGGFDGVFVDDDRFLVKVHRGGLHRTTCMNIDSATDTYIHHELQKLNELKRCVVHGWKRRDMKEAILRFMPN